jgi:hypothetical protein
MSLRKPKPLTRHQIAMRRAEARDWVLPLDQLRGLPELHDDTEICDSGVYFLWDGPELVYIGHSQNVGVRVGQHRYFNKPFTHATYEKINQHWARHRERDYVLRYTPRLNMTRLG